MTERVVNAVVQRAFSAGTPVGCEYCGQQIKLDVAPKAHTRATGDHRVPRCRGGRNVRSNIAVVCYWCNHIKGPLTADEFLAVRHDRRALRLAVHNMTLIIRGVEGPGYRNFRERVQAKNLRRQERLAERLRLPDPNCAKCMGGGRYSDKRRLERICPCALTPLDPARAAAHVDGRRQLDGAGG